MLCSVISSLKIWIRLNCLELLPCWWCLAAPRSRNTSLLQRKLEAPRLFFSFYVASAKPPHLFLFLSPSVRDREIITPLGHCVGGLLRYLLLPLLPSWCSRPLPLALKNFSSVHMYTSSRTSVLWLIKHSRKYVQAKERPLQGIDLLERLRFFLFIGGKFFIIYAYDVRSCFFANWRWLCFICFRKRLMISYFGWWKQTKTKMFCESNLSLLWM